MRTLTLGLGLAAQNTSDPTGPIQDTAPSVSPMTAQEGTQVTRTLGTYSARGGGSVSITTSEFQVDGVQVSVGATYTPDADDAGGVLTYREVATETGGTDPGTHATTITIGTVPSALGDAALLEGGDTILLENNDRLLLEAA